MSFLFPAFLAGALAIAIPIVLHFVRRHAAPPLAFSDLRFLRGAQAATVRRRRLRDWLLLALRVAALLLLAAAFARPYLDGAGVSRPLTVVALDRSFSMAFPGMFERARAAARAAVDAVPAGERVAVLAFDDAVQVAAPPETGRAGARAAIDAVEPGYGATRYAPLFEAAADLIGAAGGRIVVVTDLQRNGWNGGAGAPAPAGVDVAVRVIEPPASGNLALAALEVAPSGAVAVVVNAGRDGHAGAVTLIADGAPLQTVALELPPGATDVVFDAALPAAGVLEAVVEDPGGISADDRRYHLLGAGDQPRIVLVGSPAEAFYVDRALRAAGGLFDVRRLSPDAVDALAIDGAAAVWLLGTAGLDRAARGALAALVAAGGGLLVAAGPGLEPALVTDVLGPGASMGAADVPAGGSIGWAPGDERHPIWRPLAANPAGLGTVRFARRTAVELPGARVLAAFADGAPALLERAPAAGRLLLLASDLGNAWNDFPRRPAFVPFVHETTRYLAARQARPGNAVVGAAPPDVAPRPGVAVDPATGRTIVLNVDPAESDPARLSEAAFRARIAAGAGPAAAAAATDAAAREAAQGLWWYAILAAAVLLVGESWLGRTAA